VHKPEHQPVCWLLAASDYGDLAGQGTDGRWMVLWCVLPTGPSPRKFALTPLLLPGGLHTVCSWRDPATSCQVRTGAHQWGDQGVADGSCRQRWSQQERRKGSRNGRQQFQWQQPRGSSVVPVWPGCHCLGKVGQVAQPRGGVGECLLCHCDAVGAPLLVRVSMPSYWQHCTGAMQAQHRCCSACAVAHVQHDYEVRVCLVRCCTACSDVALVAAA